MSGWPVATDERRDGNNICWEVEIVSAASLVLGQTAILQKNRNIIMCGSFFLANFAQLLTQRMRK